MELEGASRGVGAVQGSVGGEVEQVLRMAFNNKIQYIKTKAATRNLNSASNRSRSRPGKKHVCAAWCGRIQLKDRKWRGEILCVRACTYTCMYMYILERQGDASSLKSYFS